jgi:hypothetical protein
MANEQQKPVWWQSLPGMLTAGAAFLAALTGMLAGLKELGVFQRDGAAAPEATATVDTVFADSVSPDSGRIPVESPAPWETAPPAAAPARPPSSVRPVTPPPVESTAPKPPATEHTAAGSRAVLPNGTELRLAASSRVCSTTLQGEGRVEAVVVAPVSAGDSVVLPAGAVAVLRARRVGAPTFLRLRLDSLVWGGGAVAVSRSDVRARLAKAGAQETRQGEGACVPRGGRITVTLRQDLPLGPS